jgi:hypothetical protein
MITTTHLIEQLSKFPQGARVEVLHGLVFVHHPKKTGSQHGVIDCPQKGRAAVTRLGSWKGWMDSVFHTAGGRIQRFLLEKPTAARSIAFSAVEGLYLDEDGETALPEHDCYPRGSGSDYVDQVGAAINGNGLNPLIESLQKEVEQ